MGIADKRPARPLPMVLVSAVALIDADGRVLMAKRPEGRMMAGLWEFPGGKVADGEPRKRHWSASSARNWP